jgi:uncharacterized protein (TIGR02186 family)
MMPRTVIAALMAFVGLALLAGPAGAQTLVVSLSSHRVLISSNYTGAQIAVFGAIERDARALSRGGEQDVVITITGPRRHLLVRQKVQLAGVWINQPQRRFGDAPSYLAELTSRPLGEIGGPDDLQRLRLGLRNNLGDQVSFMSSTDEEERFTQSLVRLKQQEALYQQVERGVTFLTPTLFRAAVDLPATAPPGNYDVSVRLLNGSVEISRQQTSFEVVQIGFEQRVAEFARGWGLIYGLATALAAVLFGWLATIVFRRD